MCDNDMGGNATTCDLFHTNKSNLWIALGMSLVLPSVPQCLAFAATVLVLTKAANRVVHPAMDCVTRKWRIGRALRVLPGPPSLPIIGNLHQLGKNMVNIHWWKVDMTRLYGGTYATRVDCLMDGSIVTSRPDNLEYILQTNSANYVKPKLLQDTCKEIMGESIFSINPSSPLWALQRKLMSSMFSVNSFRKYMNSVFQEHTRQCIADLYAATTTSKCDASGEQFGHGGEVVDMELILLTLTTNISFHIGFGGHVPDEMNSPQFHALFRDASSITANRFTKPWYKWFGWCMPSEWQLKAAMTDIDNMFYRIIASRQQEAHNDGAVDILSQLLARQRQGHHITDKFLRDMMMTVMLAGRETVASSLLWIVYLIALHPEVEAKVMAEVDAIKDATDYDNVAQLSYLEAVMKETWRLFPPTALELKSALHDDVLPDGTFVPAGVNVEFSPFVMGRDPTRWENAGSFIPQRWLEPTFVTPTDYEFPVFHAGKRKCVGQRIAMLQVKYILTMLYQRFRFELVDKVTPPQLTLGIALFAKGGLPVRPIVREDLTIPAPSLSTPRPRASSAA
ncbi:hypothetical protein H257_00388 [Aphanomyces astaci]|uniref:Cytochrome P450 n=2 Tax=Aphanomyces astaci TaxID=112090 RepID=W4HBK8_APHAT|nr:hypothetical protein H257_00388 [Aphanomyces astaci]ETV88956.1 hypothetical protein H257_00388 [Aphanomyces astaci]|eukprot:XP_009821356.1 hypothetical protein H257_00388 [Aphanomyces astaci]